jgi:hypothetical protein
MSQLIVMIVCHDAVNKSEELSEVWRQPLPRVTLERFEAARYLDGLEEQVTAVGWALMCQLMVEQWRFTDQALLAAYHEQHRDTPVSADGYEDLKVVSRFGVVQLPRQVCYEVGEGYPVVPGNAGLPAYAGQVTTHGWQEWLCADPARSLSHPGQRYQQH